MESRQSPVPELSPLMCSVADYAAVRGGPTRASYTHADLRALDREESAAKCSLKRSQSVPVLSSDDFTGITSMSPMFYRRHYLAGGGTMVSSAFNLASATLGAGVLALPHAMYHSGVVLGAASLLVICMCTVYSVYILVRVAELTGLHTIEELAAALIGPATEKITAVLIVVFCWGVAVMYVVVMGDFTTPLIERAGLSHLIGRKTAMTLFWVCVMLPLSLVRRINSLRYASFLGSASTLLLAFALVTRYAMRSEIVDNANNSNNNTKTTSSDLMLLSAAPHAGTIPLFRVNADALGALSTFLFSYCCQPVVLKVASEMKHSSVSRMSLCATCSMVSCTLVYIVTGVFGVLAFGDHVKPNVLANLGQQLDHPYIYLAYFGMSMAVTMAFPMTIFPTRDSVMHALGYRTNKGANGDASSCHSISGGGWLSSAIAGALAFAALLMGMFVPNIRVLFDLLGGVCGGTLSFLLPGVLALRCGHWRVAEVGWGHVVMAWFLTFAGSCMCLVGTYNSVMAHLV